MQALLYSSGKSDLKDTSSLNLFGNDTVVVATGGVEGRRTMGRSLYRAASGLLIFLSANRIINKCIFTAFFTVFTHRLTFSFMKNL